ncbi:MAG: hypothetical protein HQL71_07825 [Magnetococcales bacterium]|nr:hypothetical protein [Magnetococcales bacterium]
MPRLDKLKDADFLKEFTDDIIRNVFDKQTSTSLNHSNVTLKDLHARAGRDLNDDQDALSFCDQLIEDVSHY